MKFTCGLVSISFRSLSPQEIITHCQASGLSAIEWGSDVHVPAGDPVVAKTVAAMTESAGLKMPEYGSYHKLGLATGERISDTVSSARILQTPVIRLWASDRSRSRMSEADYRHTVSETQNICRSYPEFTFCLECHNNTLTEEYTDALQFLTDVGCDNLKMFWQPNQFKDHAYNLASLRALLPYIHSVHVFSWEGTECFPLSHHTDRWMEYLQILKTSDREEIFLMLEFMHDHRPESLPQTAQTLLHWVNGIAQKS